MKFQVYGPYQVPMKDNRTIIKSSTLDFWDEVEADVADAIGCYIFGIHARDRILPYYIGVAKNAFQKEALGKVDVYNKILATRKNGKPGLFLLPQVTPAGKFAKKGKSTQATSEALQSLLIGMGFSRNPQLANVQHDKMLRAIEVVGFTHSAGKGRVKGSAVALRDSFGVNK